MKTIVFNDAKIQSIIGTERFSSEMDVHYVVLMTIESSKNVSPEKIKQMNGKYKKVRIIVDD